MKEGIRAFSLFILLTRQCNLIVHVLYFILAAAYYYDGIHDGKWTSNANSMSIFK
jgi:hypothetical protein